MNMITPNPNLLKFVFLCCVKIINPIALNTIAFAKRLIKTSLKLVLPWCIKPPFPCVIDHLFFKLPRIILITFLRHLCSFKLHFEIWFITHQTPNYMELLPFSCLCYPLPKPSTPYKLEPKPKLCFLSSFSFIKSVYVCLDLILKKIYVFVEKLNLI